MYRGVLVVTLDQAALVNVIKTKRQSVSEIESNLRHSTFATIV